MSEFADIFSREVAEKKEKFSSMIEDGIDTEVTEGLEKVFDTKFSSYTPEDLDSEFNVVASDAGRNQIALKNNVNVFIIRAAAKDNHSGVSRELFTGVLRPFRQRDYKDFSDRSSEIVELEAILDRLESVDLDTRTFVLIDGSLMTRMLVLPSELRLSSHRTRKLDLIDRFHELLEKAREEENLVVAGVSKDSNTDVLYRTLTEKIIEEKIGELESGISEELAKKFEEVDKRPRDFRKVIENLEDAEELKNFVESYRDSYSDTMLVEALSDGPGVTDPVEVGRVSARFRSYTDDIRNDVEAFIESEFSYALEEAEDEEAFKEKVSSSLEKLFDYPTVVTSYWVPEKGAQPLRVDLFSDHWSSNSLTEFEGSQFKEKNEVLEEVVRLLETGYGGEAMHNVWISQADNSASLTHRQLENIYSPILSKKLGINLRQYLRRRDKRA